MRVRIDPLDVLFSTFVRMRAKGCCERCGHIYQDTAKENGDVLPAWKQLQCSHFYGRSKKSVRWDEDNSAGLCGACHMYLGSHPLEHVEFFKKRLGELGFDLLASRTRITYPRPDKKLLEIYFQEQIKKIKEV